MKAHLQCLAGCCLMLLASMALAQTSPPSKRIVLVEASQAIKSVGFGKCLHAPVDGSEGPEPQGRIERCDNSGEQRWYLTGTSAAGFMIRNRANSNVCLDIDGDTRRNSRTRVVFYKCQSSNPYQRWTVSPIKSPSHLVQYVIFNLGLMESGEAGQWIPKVLTVDEASDGAELYVELFLSGDFQLPKSDQLWTSPEINCYQRWREHANGLIEWSYGTNGSRGYEVNCE